MLGFGFLLLSLFISSKNLALLLYFMFVSGFRLFLFFFTIAFAQNLVIPPYSIFLFSFFLICSFFLCLYIRLFFSLFPLLFSSFSDWNFLLCLVDSSTFLFHMLMGTFSSLITAYAFVPTVGLGVKCKLDRESRKKFTYLKAQQIQVLSLSCLFYPSPRWFLNYASQSSLRPSLLFSVLTSFNELYCSLKTLEC